MELEKNCEFCLILKPIVYCKADAAHLCLLCDAKVHSANALSNRHPRTLVCEACRCRPAYVRCSDHRMFMCRGCNRSHHELSSQHQRKVISCYLGCPSAKDFAALWGFDMNQLEDQSNLREEVLTTTSAAGDAGMVTFSKSFSGPGSSSVSEVNSSVITLHKIGSNREFHKAPEQKGNAGQILRQILELKRLQLNQGTSGGSYHMRDQEEIDLSSFKHNAKEKLQENLDQQLQQSLDLDSDLQNFGSPYEKPATESFPFVISQMDGDSSFWQCKSPADSGQLWTQNMQDLGVCDDPGCLDDFSMPEVDLTFKNIEEVFGGEQELARALLTEEEDAATCSSLEKERSIEEVSAASSENVNHFSPSASRLSADAEFLDSGQSSHHIRQRRSDLENSQVDSKQNVLMRIKEKKKNRRCEINQSRYTHRKARSDARKIIRDQVMKTQEYESEDS